MGKTIFCLVAALLVSSCGKLEEKFGRQEGEGFTTVNFQPPASPAAANYNLMIYAVRTDNSNRRGSKYVSISNDAGTTSWSIPNGPYNFYTFGYDTTDQFGTMFCGKSLGHTLGGGTQNVSLPASSSNQCGIDPFAPSGYASSAHQPKPFWLGQCASSGGDMGGVDYTTPCNGSGSPARPGTGAGVVGIKITFPVYSRWTESNYQNLGTGLTTGCQCVTLSAGTATDISKKIPYGAPFVFTVETYGACVASTCSSFLGSYTFLSGAINANTNSLNVFRNASDAVVSPTDQMMKLSTSGAGQGVVFFRNY